MQKYPSEIINLFLDREHQLPPEIGTIVDELVKECTDYTRIAELCYSDDLRWEDLRSIIPAIILIDPTKASIFAREFQKKEVGLGANTWGFVIGFFEAVNHTYHGVEHFALAQALEDFREDYFVKTVTAIAFQNQRHLGGGKMAAALSNAIKDFTREPRKLLVAQRLLIALDEERQRRFEEASEKTWDITPLMAQLMRQLAYAIVR